MPHQVQGGVDNVTYEHKVVVGVGGAAELDLHERAMHVGPTVFVEWEAIDRWLELELGASLFASEGGVEVPVDLLFKKPFQLSRGFELMVGLGPELVYASSQSKTYFGVESALDFMFWPSRHAGLWVEPSFDVVLRDRARAGVGSTAGIIFGW